MICWIFYWIFKLILGVALCAFGYTLGYTDGCCETFERQAIEYIKKHAPEAYEELRERKKRIKLSEEEKEICRKYSARDEEGFVHCKECPLLIPDIPTMCKAVATEEEWEKWKHDSH